jgi:hypothetical protein
MSDEESTNPEHADSETVNDNGRIRLALDRLADAVTNAGRNICVAIAAAANGTNPPTNPA